MRFADSGLSDVVTRVRSGRVLRQDEEFRLVTSLCDLRSRIEKILRPLLSVAEREEFKHFDRLMIHYPRRLAKELAPKARRRVEELFERYNRIKHRLVVANLAWVTKLARAQRYGSLAEDDLFQEGVCGLLKAIDRFEAERGLRLMTYATWYIREAMQQVRARQSHLVSLSAHDQTLLGQVESLRTAYQHEHERLPSATEIGERMRRNPRSLSRLQSATAPVVSLDRGGLEGPLPVAVADPTTEIDRLEEIHSAVTRLMAALPDRERRIVERRFGLDGAEPASLESLGDDLNVSKERIRQLQRQAMRRMLERANDEQLELASA